MSSRSIKLVDMVLNNGPHKVVSAITPLNFKLWILDSLFKHIFIIIIIQDNNLVYTYRFLKTTWV